MRFTIGIQTLENIIERNCIYVDKTKYILQLITEGKMFFYARPRRFGKSLTISTLKCIFNGQKELFKGLYIENKWNFDIKYPIIRIDFSGLSEYYDGLEKSLQDKLLSIAKDYSVVLSLTNSKTMLADLIALLHQTYQQKVEILIDEYDKLLLDYIEFVKKERAEFNRTILQQFYSVMKPMKIKFSLCF